MTEPAVEPTTEPTAAEATEKAENGPMEVTPQQARDMALHAILELQKTFPAPFLYDACVQFCYAFLVKVGRDNRVVAQQFFSKTRNKLKEAVDGIFLINNK